MAEIERQLEPFKRSLDANTKATEAIGRWKLALWSNGSGGPPGYLEIAREQDKEQFRKIFELLDPAKKLKKWIAILTLIVAFLALMVGIFSVLEGKKISTGELKISHTTTEPVVSSNQPQQNASDLTIP
jgi:hypothetical protein